MAAARTDRGRRREENEDTFALSPADPAVLVVADGMGGHPAGEVASRIAADAVLRFLAGMAEPYAADGVLSDGVPAARGGAPQGEAQVGLSGAPLEAALLAAHRAVLEAAGLRPEWRGMGTALTVVRISGEQLETCHAGDVRVYLLRDGALLQVTADHSMAAAMMRRGALTAAQVRGHRLRHQLSQALGGPGAVEPESHQVRLAPGDLVLLCSDGLWEAVSDERMASLLLAAPAPLERRVASLVEAANDAGGHDNITAVAYEHGGDRQSG